MPAEAVACEISFDGGPFSLVEEYEYAFTDERAASYRAGTSAADIDIYWLPRGAGGHSVRLNDVASVHARFASVDEPA